MYAIIDSTSQSRAWRRIAVLGKPSLLAALLLSCSSDGASGPPPRDFSYFLDVGPGITAAPAGTQTSVDGTGFIRYEARYQEGRVVQYSFTPKDNIAAVLVTLDGSPAPATGTVTMDRDHSFSAVINTKVGARMPEFVGQGADGATVRLSDYRGKIVLVDFSEMTCPGSIVAAPVLQSLYATYRARGLEIMTVLVYGPTTNVRSTTSDLLSWQRTYGLSFPVVSDPSNATKIFNLGVTGRTTDFPTIYVVDATGLIRFRFGTFDDAGLKAALATLFP